MTAHVLKRHYIEKEEEMIFYTVSNSDYVIKTVLFTIIAMNLHKVNNNIIGNTDVDIMTTKVILTLAIILLL